MDWTTTLKALAPTVATALGGPLAGMAIEALGSVLGVSSPTQEKIAAALTNSQMTPEQVSEIKKLEMQYQQTEKERDFRYEELVYKDRDSARLRETSVKDNVNRNLAYLVVGAFLALVIATLLGAAKVESVLAGTLVGYLSAKAEQVLAYYFGSSKSSDRKTELLASAPAVSTTNTN